jgi:hypothetical protein
MSLQNSAAKPVAFGAVNLALETVESGYDASNPEQTIELSGLGENAKVPSIPPFFRVFLQPPSFVPARLPSCLVFFTLPSFAPSIHISFVRSVVGAGGDV